MYSSSTCTITFAFTFAFTFTFAGLTSLDELSQSWLPCLQKLKLVANGLSSLPVLYRICPLLQWLDVSNNMLFDTQVSVSLSLPVSLLRQYRTSRTLKDSRFVLSAIWNAVL